MLMYFLESFPTSFRNSNNSIQPKRKFVDSRREGKKITFLHFYIFTFYILHFLN